MRKNIRKFATIKCAGCGFECQKPLKEIERQIKNGNNVFYCSRVCFGKNGPKPTKKPKVIKKCLICLSEFESTTKQKAAKTCSISCAGKLGMINLTEDQKEKKSEKIRELWRNGTFDFKRKYIDLPKEKSYYNIEKICLICNKQFISKSANVNKPNKTCSKECCSELMSQLARENPNCGGETNYKRYKYKDITMDSSWEVELAQWMDENNIKWIRSRKICLYWKDEAGDLRRYYPDFYLPDFDVYLDPKNKYLQEKDAFKLKSVQEEQNIKIFSGFLEDIKKNIQELSHSNPSV